MTSFQITNAVAKETQYLPVQTINNTCIFSVPKMWGENILTCKFEEKISFDLLYGQVHNSLNFLEFTLFIKKVFHKFRLINLTKMDLEHNKN